MLKICYYHCKASYEIEFASGTGIFLVEDHTMS
jgi:hypothetical protein